MEFKITGRHLEITPAIREYAQGKTQRLHRFFDRIQQIAVVVDQRDRLFEVEIITDVEHHDSFVARGKGADLYACIDEVVDKAERQLVDHKERLRNRKHNT